MRLNCFTNVASRQLTRKSFILDPLKESQTAPRPHKHQPSCHFFILQPFFIAATCNVFNERLTNVLLKIVTQDLFVLGIRNFFFFLYFFLVFHLLHVYGLIFYFSKLKFSEKTFSSKPKRVCRCSDKKISTNADWSSQRRVLWMGET